MIAVLLKLMVVSTVYCNLCSKEGEDEAELMQDAKEVLKEKLFLFAEFSRFCL